jgi:predicted dehydrogenase
MTKLKGAFIGFGNIAQFGHWPSYEASPDAEIVAIMDPSPARQEAAKKLNSSLRAYGTVEDLFRHEQLDFVDICTPPSSHTALAIQALEKKCHVLCEKPLTLKESDYQELSKAVAASGRVLFTVHNWKFAPIFQRAFSLIKENRIGLVWHVEIFTLRDNVCKGSTDSVQSEDWRKNASVAGGGILVDHGWHSFYLLLNLVGAEPQKILAKMLKDRENPESLEEAVQLLVQFPEADGYVHLTWRAKMRRNNLIVQGQSGTLLIDDDRILLSTTRGDAREEFKFDSALSAGSHHADWFKALLPQFIEEIKNPAKRGANLREAGWCLALTAAAYQSNLQGFKEVPVLFPVARSSLASLA